MIHGNVKKECGTKERGGGIVSFRVRYINIEYTDIHVVFRFQQ